MQLISCLNMLHLPITHKTTINRHSSNIELSLICIPSTIGHDKNTWTVLRDNKSLIIEFLSIDTPANISLLIINILIILLELQSWE